MMLLPFLSVCLLFHYLLFHFLPIYQSLALFVQIHGQGYHFALVGLEWFGVLLRLNLSFGC